MLAQLEMIPIGTPDASLSHYIAKVAKLVMESGLSYRLGAMGTVVEGEWDPVMAVIRRCHEALLQDADRVVTIITIDDRKDKPGAGRLQQKLDSLATKLGRGIVD